jgi:hypothetical protein
MNSTCSKVSNGILFVIFGLTNQQIWILQDLNKIWFRILIWIYFDPRLATWSLPIGPYRFGRIRSGRRWILSDLDGPDAPITVRLSYQSVALDRDLTIEIKEGKAHRNQVRVPMTTAGETARVWVPVDFSEAWTTAKLWRGEGGHGGLGSVVVVEDCFLNRCSGAAGVAQGGRCFGS